MFLFCLLLIGLIAIAIENETKRLEKEQTELVPIPVIDQPVEIKPTLVK